MLFTSVEAVNGAEPEVPKLLHAGADGNMMVHHHSRIVLSRI
jgi:hypothetical protein